MPIQLLFKKDDGYQKFSFSKDKFEKKNQSNMSIKRQIQTHK